MSGSGLNLRLVSTKSAFRSSEIQTGHRSPQAVPRKSGESGAVRAPLCSRSRLRLNRGGTLTKPFPVRYQHQLERATFDVEEEYGSIDELDIKVDRLIEVYPSPVSEVVLRQVIPLTPTHRHFMLVFGFWTEWWPNTHPGSTVPCVFWRVEQPFPQCLRG